MSLPSQVSTVFRDSVVEAAAEYFPSCISAPADRSQAMPFQHQHKSLLVRSMPVSSISTATPVGLNPDARPFSTKSVSFNPDAAPFVKPRSSDEQPQLRLDQQFNRERWADLVSCSESDVAVSECDPRSLHGRSDAECEASLPARDACPPKGRSPLHESYSAYADTTYASSPCEFGTAYPSSRPPSSTLSHKCTVGFALPRVCESAALDSAASNSAPIDGSCSLSENVANLRISVPVDAVNPDSAGDGPMARSGYRGVLGMVHGISSPAGEPKIEAVLTVQTDEKVRGIVRSCVRGLRAHQEPVATRDGMGGTYFMKDENALNVAIFKPCDEEPLAPNNPKGWEGRAIGAPGMKPCVRVGEAALREVAAYVLDHDGFAGVPPACLVHAYHPVLCYKVRMPRIESLRDVGSAQMCLAPRKTPNVSARASLKSLGSAKYALSSPGEAGPAATAPAGALARALSRQTLGKHPADLPSPVPVDGGASRGSNASIGAGPAPQASHPGELKLGSLQAFVAHTCDANDLSPSCFAADDIHRIGILDLRLLNCDRHAGNLLVAERPRGEGGQPGPAYSLIPIDHGYALPEALDEPYFEWLFWPQASVPFSTEAREYIRKLDAQSDIALLRRLIPALREECLRCLEVTTTVLQMGAEAGLTLFEIGQIFSRSTMDLPSDLEVMCMDAREDALLAPPRLCSSSSLLSSAGGGGGAVAGGSASLGTPNAHSPRLGFPRAHGSSVGSAPVSPLRGSILSLNPSDMDREDVFNRLVFECDQDDLSPCQHGNTLSNKHSSSSLSSPPTLPAASLHEPLGPSAQYNAHQPLGIKSTHSLRSSHYDADVATTASSDERLVTLAAATDDDSSGAATTFTSKDRAVEGSGAEGEEDHRGGLCSPLARLASAQVHVSKDTWHAAPPRGKVRSSWRDRRNAWRMKQSVRQHKAAYPPPLLARHPDQANYVFTGLSDGQWRVFMDRIMDFVTEELHKGTWCISRSQAPVANSCPLAFIR